MKWLARAVLPLDRERADQRPVALVVMKTWEFATSIAFVNLVASVLSPDWSADMTPKRLLFVATFGGVLMGLMTLAIARTTTAPVAGAKEPPIT